MLNAIASSRHNTEEFVQKLDDFRDFFDFSLASGRFRLGPNRLLTLYASTYLQFRSQMFLQIGYERTSKLFFEMGFSGGVNTAIELQRYTYGSYNELFRRGLELLVLHGGGVPIIQDFLIDSTAGVFRGLVVLENSAEVDESSNLEPYAVLPKCWLHSGYLSGFASCLFGKEIFFRETACRSSGADVCMFCGDLKSSSPPNPEVTPHLTGHLAGDKIFAGEHGIIGSSPAMRTILNLVEKISKTSIPVLIQGETGVGKEVIAHLIHKCSDRADGPFVPINCAAIPDNLFESELFGVEKGAFTGAHMTRSGKFELANGGTIFLDEIGTLTPAAQGKLLRVIQEKEVSSLGGAGPKKIDFRIIAATNIDLANATKKGDFREDLFHRINAFNIYIPPLRKRREDIICLANFFIEKASLVHKKNLPGFTRAAVEALMTYDYPGNVRQLQQMIECSVVMADDDKLIDMADLFCFVRPSRESSEASAGDIDNNGNYFYALGIASEIIDAGS